MWETQSTNILEVELKECTNHAEKREALKGEWTLNHIGQNSAVVLLCTGWNINPRHTSFHTLNSDVSGGVLPLKADREQLLWHQWLSCGHKNNMLQSWNPQRTVHGKFVTLCNSVKNYPLTCSHAFPHFSLLKAQTHTQLHIFFSFGIFTWAIIKCGRNRMKITAS